MKNESVLENEKGNYLIHSLQTDNSNYAPPPVSRLSGNVREGFTQYAVDKIKFNAMSANDYAKRSNLYQSGLKGGAVITLIGCLNQMGVDVDCESETLASGAMIFKSVTVDGKKIFG